MEAVNELLLSEREEYETLEPKNPLITLSNASFYSSFTVDENDIEPINGFRDFYREFSVESKKLWLLAGPAIFTSICQYTLGAITQIFAGHLGTLELAAFSVANNIVAGFSFGVMV